MSRLERVVVLVCGGMQCLLCCVGVCLWGVWLWFASCGVGGVWCVYDALVCLCSVLCVSSVGSFWLVLSCSIWAVN